MSSQNPTKQDWTPGTLASGKGVLDWLMPVVNSTVGSKFLVAITGFLMVGFVVGHMVGNLKVFGGPEAINSYAKFLKDQGALLWVARFGLLGLVALHVILAIRLKRRSREARPVGYVFQQTIQASQASRSMLLTGAVVFAFIVFHIAHYTMGLVHKAPSGVNYLELKDAAGRHDVYTMVIFGFSTWWITLLYVIAQLLLFVHLSHGISSVFQTLGWNTPRLQPTWKKLGYAVSGLILVGNLSIVLAIQFGWRYSG